MIQPEISACEMVEKQPNVAREQIKKNGILADEVSVVWGADPPRVFKTVSSLVISMLL